MTTSTRCAACKARRKAVRNEAAPTARAVVEAWRAQHGDLCPGYERDPHPASDLTGDHVVPLAAGGSNQGEWAVLCRSCNARKGARTS